MAKALFEYNEFLKIMLLDASNGNLQGNGGTSE